MPWKLSESWIRTHNDTTAAPISAAGDFTQENLVPESDFNITLLSANSALLVPSGPIGNTFPSAIPEPESDVATSVAPRWPPEIRRKFSSRQQFIGVKYLW